MSPPDTCALCYRSDTNDITGRLQRTPDGSVVAHYNCMLYSPLVISKDSKENVKGFDFNIESVLSEIKRGRKLRCNVCKKGGATVGCNIRSCKRKYHYPCVKKAKGSPVKDGYVVYCFEHKTEITANGSEQNSTIEMALPQDNENGAMTTGHPLNTDVTNMSTCSDNGGDKTSGRLPGNIVHVSPLRSSTEENHVTEEQPASSLDEEIPGKASASSSKRKKRTINDVISKLKSKLLTLSSHSNIEDRPCKNTVDAFSCAVDSTDIPETWSPVFSNGTIRPIMQSMTQITGNSVEHAVGLSNDTGLPTQQIHSTNSKETLSSQPTDCTDASKSIGPDTLVGCFLNSFNEQPANDLAAQGTSETHPSGCPSVTEPESPFCSSLTLEKDGNKTEVSTSVSDVSQENMESDVSAPLCYNREILPVASPSNAKTLQNEKGQKKGTISNIVSPEQITALSRNLITGNLRKCFKSIVPQIKNTVNSSKRKTAQDTEQRQDGEAISEESANPSIPDQPESTGSHLHEPLENQENSDKSIKEKDLVCQERSKSITSKRKRSQDSEDLLPNIKLQQTEGNLPEQLEIHNFRENATSGSVESEHALEHHSGPSRMNTLVRRRLFPCIPRSKRQSGFRHERVRDPIGIDGFGRVVAGQCRRMPQDRQVKYMSFVLTSADLFCTLPTIPDSDILLANLRTVLEGSQQSTPCSARGSLV